MENKLSNEVIIDVYLKIEEFNTTTDFPFRKYENFINSKISDRGENNEVTIRFLPCRASSSSIHITIISFEEETDYASGSDLDEVIKTCLEGYFKSHNILIMKYFLTQESQSNTVYTFDK
ncbi:MAG: hypothetical protein WCR67_01020 [Bacilli bacterium]